MKAVVVLFDVNEIYQTIRVFAEINQGFDFIIKLNI